jgi:hypothetical protein
LPTSADVQANRCAFSALSSAATRIAREQGQCHVVLVSEAVRLARLINRRLVSERDVQAALVGAVRMSRASQPQRDKEAEPEVEKVLAWALARSND